MSRLFHLGPRIRRDESGATLVEFAFVAPILSMVLLGLFDLGYGVYASSALDGALHDAARMATLGEYTGAEIDAVVQDRLSTFKNGGSVVVDMKSYSEFSDVRKPEKITSDTVPLNRYNAGDCYEDANNNGQYDLDRGRTGLGQADDIVNYEVSLTYNRLLPMASMLGWGNSVTIKHSTVLRNQPYAARSTGVVVRC